MSFLFRLFTMNFLFRLITTIVFPVVLVFFALYMTGINCLSIAIINAVTIFLAATELNKILNPGKSISIWPFLMSLLPIVAWWSITYRHNLSYFYAVVILSEVLILCFEVLKNLRSSTFEEAINRCVTDMFMYIYMGFFGSHIYLTIFSQPEQGFGANPFMFIYLLSLVFITDVFSYIFGKLFGASTKGIVTISPGKSLLGYIGGIAATSLLSIKILDLLKTLSGKFNGMSWKSALLLGFLCAVISDIGDLFESMLKRSSNVKDSGHIIPGRGGMLDSIDSLFFTAPIFYYLFYLSLLNF